jgi:hypothetical protein
VRDIVFIALVLGFFSIAALFVRGCDFLVGPASDADAEQRR